VTGFAPSGADIVVVGMAVEAPGGIGTPGQLWDALADGREMLGPLPDDRGWDLRLLASLGEREGWQAVPDSGGFLSGAALFDPGFFGISPREAAAMDPQQRVALRVAHKALENAGINPDALGGSETGTFLGANINGYGPSMAAVGAHSGYLLPGVSLSSVSGRVSHALGLAGPSLTVDTGCAASLSAIHLAAAFLRLGECELALAGGVTVMGSEMMFVEFAKNGALSADGHCRPFSELSTGTVWGEGAGIVVLETAERAAHFGHRIHGRILGSAMNHNGAGGAISAPSEEGQRRLVAKAIAAAGIALHGVDAVEGHGTGTPAGDPVELRALAATHGAAAAARGARIPVGSAKSNLGHTQAAAGAIGLIKMLLSGAHAQHAPTLFADAPSTQIDWDASGLMPAAKLEPWPARGGRRVAAVSGFGIAGGNAHLIVDMPEEPFGV
jgi:mycobactin polyketide synthetase MbtC